MSKRIKFFLGHLSASILIALCLSVIVFFYWYPWPLAKAVGVTHLFCMLLIIDLIIGPLFGLLVYKQGKKTLKFDLATVIVLQIAALGYGFYTIGQGRPAWIVYNSLSFVVVKNSDIEPKYLQKAETKFQQPSWLHPNIVAIQSIYTSQQKQIFDSPDQEHNNAINRHPAYYTDFANAKIRLQMNSSPVSALEQYNDKQMVFDTLRKYPKADAWMGLSAPVQDMVVLINKEKGEVVKIVDLRPWN